MDRYWSPPHTILRRSPKPPASFQTISKSPGFGAPRFGKLGPAVGKRSAVRDRRGCSGHLLGGQWRNQRQRHCVPSRKGKSSRERQSRRFSKKRRGENVPLRPLCGAALVDDCADDVRRRARPCHCGRLDKPRSGLSRPRRRVRLRAHNCRSGSDSSSAPLSAPRKRRRCGNLDRWPSGGGQACCECTDHINCRGAKSRQRRDRAGAFDHEQLRDAGSGGACCYSDGADKSECVSPPAGCH
jgi:hypothetical protein